MIFLFIDLALLGCVLVLFILFLIYGQEAFAANILSHITFICPYLLLGFPLAAAIVKTITSAKRVFTGIIKFLLYFISSMFNILVIYGMFWYLVVLKPQDPNIFWLEKFIAGIFMMVPLLAHIFLTNSSRKDIERREGLDIVLIFIAIAASLIALSAQFLLIRNLDTVTLKGIIDFIF